ncbi:hypothetical protein RJ640_022028 [Escallonia rubra]|uniref:Cellulose synthase-like protein G2 n=1 Tax=Escallonia rubra TaxID=112253 RepID=A0AA88R568_9ASTE|nr:hypothetical protein RJ640_022028 [Escallonia rubra]
MKRIRAHRSRCTAVIRSKEVIRHQAEPQPDTSPRQEKKGTLALFYYRISPFLYGKSNVPVGAWGLMTTSEVIFALVWLLTQAFRLRPVVRTVNLESLPGDAELPRVDVFICTADPTKEPVMEVMNTVLSAMALDYPPEKLAVYLSDDGGAALTLYAIKEACSFAKKSWLPFCRKYGIKTRCPEAYFSSFGDDERLLGSDEFKKEEEETKSAYLLFKKIVGNSGVEDSVVHDRPPRVEVIHDSMMAGEHKDNHNTMPLLVYIAREKRPSHPHRFKAGALNALLRVSGIMSNGTYMLVLDCDMYCNDPASARQAMCFHLEPKISKSLAFVQYPQIFYNVSKNDIYDGQARSAYKTKYQGMDGIGGSVCAGTGYYLKKSALYSSPDQDDFLLKPEKHFGFSRKFNASLKHSYAQKVNGEKILSDAVLEEAMILASCGFEENTKWGKEASKIYHNIGYSYDSLLESTFTGYLLHCKGWKSVYLYPKRPCFLGCTTIDMKDALVQLMKWTSGLFQVGLSRFSPLTYGMSRMSLLQSMCYGYFTFSPLLSFALLIYGIIPPLCLLNGIPLYPKVSNTWFMVFGSLYLSSLGQHLYEVLSTGGTIRTVWNEQRIWIIKIVTSCLFGCLDVLAKSLGITKASFRLTNKATDQKKLEKYEKGIFDFQGANKFMIPLIILIILNIICFIGGVQRVIIVRNFEEMFVQLFLSTFNLILSYPVLKGLIQKLGK